jgi:hypothetical protein
MSTTKEKICAKKERLARKVRKALRPLSEKEIADKAKAEEFWSDPCWSDALDHAG